MITGVLANGLILMVFSSRTRRTRYWRGWSSDVCSSDLLGLPGEALCAVPPLPVGAGSEAVALLGQRARAAVPGLVLTPQDEDTLTELCRRLDGIPLAI